MPTFSSLGVPEALVRSLADGGITEPFPIQTATLPDALAGRDVLGRGRTGSGKTLAFALPVVARLAGLVGPDGLVRPDGGAPDAVRHPRRPRHPRGLVLAPTRELATQIAETLEPLARAAGLRVTTVFGGVSQHRQVVALDAGVDVVVACPGRLEDLMGQGRVSLRDVAVTVLDEADHMADLGFLPGVRRILSATPSDGQRLLFSATLDRGVDRLVQQFLHQPTTHSVDSAQSPVASMTHHLFTVDGAETKRAVVQHLASGTGRRILFTRTKHQAKKLAKQLTAAGVPAVDLQGNLSQNARERHLTAFASGEVRVLVATDIAARGIHVDEVELVVHVDPPAEHKAYLHRSGRTARAGSGGDVVTVVLPEQVGDVRTLVRQARITAPLQPVRAGGPLLAALVGELAAPVAPVASVAQASATQGSARRARSGGGGRGAGGAAGRGGAGRGSGAAGRGSAGAGHAGAGRGAADDGRGAGSGAAGSSRRRRSGRGGSAGATGTAGTAGTSGGSSSGRSASGQARAAAAQGRSAISAFPVQPGGTSQSGSARRAGSGPRQGARGQGAAQRDSGGRRRDGAVEMSRNAGRRGR